MNLNREYKGQRLLTEEFREERDRYMGKVRYELTDGSVPEKTDGVVRVKSPLDLKFNEGDKLSVGLGLSFSVPVIIVENPYLAKNGLALDNNGKMFLAGVEPVADLLLPNGRPAMEVDRGQTLVYVVPLDSNFKLEAK